MTTELWTQLASSADVDLSQPRIDQLERYLDLLITANERMNLTRITDRSAARVRHIADALTLLRFIPAGEIMLADVGSGGGVPGLPLAIARPDARITLIEATKKKAAFLRETAAALSLTNVIVRDVRAEEAGHNANMREKFHVVTARAVGTLDWLAEWCLPLVKVGGTMLAMKGEKTAVELPAAAHAIRILGGGRPIVHPVALPGIEHATIVQIPKIAHTGPKYPRPATSAKGKPLT